MFLVLVVHADCWTLGFPENADFIEEPLQSFTKVVIESAAIVCVNVFVLISGWFGIKPSIKGLSNFIFQCIYFLFGIYMVLILIGKTDLSFQGIAYCLCLSEWNWFIKAYATLYILSPILNAFVAKASKKEFASVLLVFFIFQTVYGWSGAAKFVEGGYSSFSFIGLYLLSKYVKTYGLKFVTHWGGVFYVLSILINTAMYWIGNGRTFAYCNPIVIIGSLGLLLFFNNLRIKTNTVINWISKSCFAVFLLHTNPNLAISVFQSYVKDIFNQYSGIECVLLICLFLILIYILAILLDQPRKLMWKFISSHF